MPRRRASITQVPCTTSWCAGSNGARSSAPRATGSTSSPARPDLLEVAQDGLAARPGHRDHNGRTRCEGRLAIMSPSDVASRQPRYTACAAISRSNGSRVQASSSAWRITKVSGGSSTVQRGSSATASAGRSVVNTPRPTSWRNCSSRSATGVNRRLPACGRSGRARRWPASRNNRALVSSRITATARRSASSAGASAHPVRSIPRSSRSRAALGP